MRRLGSGMRRPLFETGDKIKFENGVHYSLVLPAGSVCTFREEIANEEAVLNFVGSYTEPVEQIRYEWCSLFDTPKIEVIGEVSFRYNIPVTVVESSKMQLYTADGTTLVKEADQESPLRKTMCQNVRDPMATQQIGHSDTP